MNTLSISGSPLPIVSYTLTDSLAGLSGSISFRADSAAILSALNSPFSADLDGNAFTLCAESCRYSPATGQADLTFVDTIQRALQTARPTDAAVDLAAAKLSLAPSDLEALFPVTVRFADVFSLTPAALPVDSCRGLLDSVCRDFGFIYKNTGTATGVKVFADAADAVPADAVLVSSADSFDLQKTAYSGAVGVKTSLANRKKIRAGHYMPAGKEEEADKEEDKRISGLDWSAVYDLTGVVEWPNYPPTQPENGAAPLLTRDLCLEAQKPFTAAVTYGRLPTQARKDGGTNAPQTGAEPQNSMYKIAEIVLERSPNLCVFPCAAQVSLHENQAFSGAGGFSRAYDYIYKIYFGLQDTALSVVLTDHGQTYPFDNSSPTAWPWPTEMAKLNANPTYSHRHPLAPPDLVYPAAAYRSDYTDTIDDPASSPSHMLYGDEHLAVAPGAFPWAFLTRTAEAAEVQTYDISDNAAADYHAPTEAARLQGAVPQKIAFGQVKFTKDFDLYDPDIPRHRYDSEVATAAESSATFDPTATISDPSVPGNLYYVSAAPYYYLYDTDTGTQIPVWNKSLRYENADPQTGQISCGQAEIAGIAALNSYGLYENPSTPPQVFLPTIKYSLVKQKGVADAEPAASVAVGIQQKKDQQSFRQPVLSTGIYRTQSVSLQDPNLLADANLATGLAGVLAEVREKPAVGTISGGEISEYAATASRDKQLGKIIRVGTETGEVLSVQSSLWPADDAEIEAALQRILAKENRGGRIKKCSFLLNFDIKSGQKYSNFIITTVTHDSAKGLSVATMEA